MPDGWDPKTWFRAVEQLVSDPGPPDVFLLKAAFVIRHLALAEQKNPGHSLIVRTVETKRRERLSAADQANAPAVAPEPPMERVSV